MSAKVIWLFAFVILYWAYCIYWGIRGARMARTAADYFISGRVLPLWVFVLAATATSFSGWTFIGHPGLVFRDGFQYAYASFYTITIPFTGVMFLKRQWMLGKRYGYVTPGEMFSDYFRGDFIRILTVVVALFFSIPYLGVQLRASGFLFHVLTDTALSVDVGMWMLSLVVFIYVASGGLRAVAVTDALQSVVMVVASFALFCTVWMAVGGWGGAGERLESDESGLSAQLLQAGTDDIAVQGVAGESPETVARRLLIGGELSPGGEEIVTRSPAWLVSLAWLIIGLGYAVVNHTQSMRLFGARSEWDLRMAVVVSGLVLLVLNFTNLSVGIFGRALYPDPGLMPLAAELQVRDSTFPLIVRELTSAGLRGVIVAGVVAACFSTFDSIGSTVPSLLVRDVLARLFVKNRPDSYFVSASRWLTPVVILGAFAFVPLMMQERGMLMVFLDWVGAFVVPLLAVYLMGAFTRVHRSSATWGLVVGIVYGTLKLLAPVLALRFGVALLPAMLVNNYAGTVISLLLTVAAMLAVSVVRGWEPSSQPRELALEGWLRDSRAAIAVAKGDQRSATVPILLAGTIVAIGAALSFVVFW